MLLESGTYVKMVQVQAMVHTVLAQVVPITDQVANLFLDKGILGACVVALAVVVWRKDMALQAALEARTADAKELSATLVDVSKAVALNTQSLERLAQLIQTQKLAR